MGIRGRVGIALLVLAVAGCSSGKPAAAPSTAASAAPSTAAPPPSTAHHHHRKAKPKPKPKQPPKVDGGVDWPVYGLDVAHTRDGSRFAAVRPPYRVVWVRHEQGLLEFPPSYHRGTLFVSTDGGWLKALRLRDGVTLWKHHLSMLPSQAAYAQGLVVIGDFRLDRLYAYDAATGRLRWQRSLREPIESSPIVVGQSVYVGGNAGGVYAIRLHSGRLRWRVQAAGPVKGSPTYANGAVYFGDYSGHVTRVSAASGSVIWSAAVNGPVYGSVAYRDGRLFAGTNSGYAYALSAASGRVLWSVAMGGYTYSSPAVSDGIAYFSSFNGLVDAIGAASGRVLWQRGLGYPTLSSPTRIGPLVYVADRGTSGATRGTLHAYDPRSGRERWRFPDGKYSSVVVADRMLVVAGLSRLYLLDPRGDRRGLFRRRG
jgi:outer membrane protein assembly factor BamB